MQQLASDIFRLLIFVANAKSTEQHTQPLHKKNCDKEPTDNEMSSRQKVLQKPEEKWKVVRKDTKNENHAPSTRHTVVEPDTQSKSRKKRNRRNRDRTASSATLDFRSTSCSTVREDDDDCPKNHISETKSFHTSDKIASKEKPATGVSKQPSHTKSDHLPDMFSCRSSAGDVGMEEIAVQPAKAEKKPASVASFCPGYALHFCIKSNWF